jgi:hypothetical protein
MNPREFLTNIFKNLEEKYNLVKLFKHQLAKEASLENV